MNPFVRKKYLREFVEKFGNVRSVLVVLLAAQLGFLILYKSFFEEALKRAAFASSDPLSVPYYGAILGNLDIAAGLFSALLLLIIFYYNYLRKFINFCSQRERFTLLACIALLVVIQSGIIVSVKTLPLADSSEYFGLAQRWYSLRAYVNEAGMPTAFWPVGYPALLSLLQLLFGTMVVPARLFNIGVSVCFVLVLHAVFRRWFDARERAIFIFIICFSPNLIFSTNILLTDFPFSLILWTSVYLYLRRAENIGTWLAIGVLSGIASYLRPFGLLIPAVFGLAAWRDGRMADAGWKMFGGLCLFALSLAPWVIRNEMTFHAFIPSTTNGGYNFLEGNHHGASGGTNQEFPYNWGNPDEAEESRLAYKRGLDEIASHPVETLMRLPRKLYHLFRRGDSSLTWTFKHTESSTNPLLLSFLFYGSNLVYFLVLLASLITAARWRNVQGLTDISPIVPLLYGSFILICLVYVGSERYLIPVFPIHQFLFVKFFGIRTGSARQSLSAAAGLDEVP